MTRCELIDALPVDRRPAEQFTPLMHAALWGHVGPVKAMLDTGLVGPGKDVGANVDTGKSSDGFTALNLAALMGQTDVMRVLLRAGCGVTGTSAGGKDFCAGLTPLHAASKNGHVDAVQPTLPPTMPSRYLWPPRHSPLSSRALPPPIPCRLAASRSGRV